MHTSSARGRKSFAILTVLASLGGGAAAEGALPYEGHCLYSLSVPPGGSIASIQGISAGQTFGSVQVGSSIMAATWGTDGSLTVLQPTNLGPGYSSSAIQTTVSGVQGGYAVNGDNNQNHAMIWNGAANTAADLNPTNLYGYYTSQINAMSANQQVGSGASVLHGNHGLIWTGTPGSAIDVNPAGATGSVLMGTDGIHQVGYAGPSQYQSQAGMWSGTADSYVNLAPAGVFGSKAVAVGGNQEVGYSGGNPSNPLNPYPDGQPHAMLWTGSASSAVNLQPSGYSASWAVATNGSEQAGNATLFSPDDIEYDYAFVWQGTAASGFNLQQMLPAGAKSSWAYSIDPAGDIYGVELDNFGGYHAVEWTPVPEPSALAGMVLAASSLLFIRARRT